MSFLTTLASKTVGRFAPGLRTVSQFVDIYIQIVETRGLCAKTVQNHRNYIKHIRSAFGEHAIGSVKPHMVANAIAEIGKKHPLTAKRTLMEMSDMFNEALMAGWIDTNPAQPVKRPRARVTRQRLTVEEWSKILDWSKENQPPWVSRMLVLALVTGQRRGDLQKMKFSDVWDGVLHVAQQKRTGAREFGARVAIPLSLRLPSIGISLEEAIEYCRTYFPADSEDAHLIRKSTGKPLSVASMSWRFEEARDAVLGLHTGKGRPASLHECRSLSCRIYKEESGIDVQGLLGHRHQSMTEIYTDDRGLSDREAKWMTLVVDNPAPENQKDRAAA